MKGSLDSENRGHLVKVKMVILVKIENGLSKFDTIIINIYIYLIVRNESVSEIENDHFDLDQMTTIL